MQLVEPPEGTFTTQELERLAAYRAAVQAGFYTDGDAASSSSTEADNAAGTPPTGGRPRRVQPRRTRRVNLG